MSRHIRGDGLTLELARSLHLVVGGTTVLIEHITTDGHPAIRFSSRDCSVVDETQVLRGISPNGAFVNGNGNLRDHNGTTHRLRSLCHVNPALYDGIVGS